jgi:hypothetical protein
MGGFSEFFKESDESFGVFYPKHYIIATFPTYSAAKDAYQSLRKTGCPEDEVLLATGSEVLEYFKHFREDAGVWGAIMRPISKFFGTEAAFSEHDVEQAKERYGFLAVHSSTDGETERIAQMLTPFAPSSMEWYLSGGIRSLV